MVKESFYQDLITRFTRLIEENGLLEEEVEITGKSLSVEEAIGNPERRDYPLIKGKEKLMQADFKGFKGQAFTDMAGTFKDTLKAIINRPLRTNYDRAVFIAALNAVTRYLGISEGTVHCKDEEPEKCAQELVNYIKNKYGTPKIALIGLQPAILDQLARHFHVRVSDLAQDNIGKIKSGVTIEDGDLYNTELVQWCDLVVCTGSTVVNGTINQFIGFKPTVFFGTTISGVAKLLKIEQFCFCSS